MPLKADAIVEPSDDGIVDMLNVLPPIEKLVFMKLSLTAFHG